MLSRDTETAKAWAERLHRGQVDKSGAPYIHASPATWRRLRKWLWVGCTIPWKIRD